MDLLIFGGLTVGLLTVSAIAVATRAAQYGETETERCESCGIERASIPAGVEEAAASGHTSLACPECGSFDPRLLWLDGRFWD